MKAIHRKEDGISFRNICNAMWYLCSAFHNFDLLTTEEYKYQKHSQKAIVLLPVSLFLSLVYSSKA